MTSGAPAMKRYRAFGFALLGMLLAAVLAYSGWPVGSHVEISGRSAMITCRYLHWDGIRSKDIDLSGKFNPNLGVSDTECWRNWF